jgi:hypothetical protein
LSDACFRKKRFPVFGTWRKSAHDAQMTLMDKESRHNIDQVYDQCCKTQKITNADCQCFYANLKALEPVVSTDEGPEYTIVHNDLIKCFRDVRRAAHVVI